MQEKERRGQRAKRRKEENRHVGEAKEGNKRAMRRKEMNRLVGERKKKIEGY